MVETPIKKSLRSCIKEGVVSQIMTGIFDYYLIPFALYLNASTPQIGFLVSIPPLLASFSQFWAVPAVHWAGGAKKLLTGGAFIQAILLIPIGFLIFDHGSNRILWLISLVSVFRLIGNVIGPAWGGIVSAYLPSHLRGEYFGRRSQITAIAGLANVFIWGAFLSWMSHAVALAFLIVFLTAAAMRFFSFYYLGHLVELPAAETPEDRFTFWMFVRRFKESNFVKFIFYVAGITFATQLSAAYFSVYMLQDLKLSYMNYTLINLSSMVTGLLVFPMWGKHADLVGNVRIMKVTGALLCINPILWAFLHVPWQLMLNEAFSGFVWGGFNLCSANFIYDAVSPNKRVRCLGYFNLINGMAMFAGAGLGGYLSKYLPLIHGFSLPTLFLCSALIRLLVHGLLSRHFNEVRPAVKHVHSTKLFLSVLGVRPLNGATEWPAFPLIKHLPFKRLLKLVD